MLRILLLLVYFGVSGGIGWRVGRLAKGGWRWVIWGLAAMLVFGFLAGIAMGDCFVGRILRVAGAGWILMWPFLTGAWVVCEAVGFFARRRGWKGWWCSGWTGVAVCGGVVLAMLGWGWREFSTPVVVPVVVEVPVDARSGMVGKELRVVVASDWHLGDVAGRKRTRGWVDLLNGLGADLILLPGDVIDHDVEQVRKQGSGEELKKLRARLGVWAVTGNHERYAGEEKAVAFLRECGVKVLMDEWGMVDGVVLAGWKDGSEAGVGDVLRGARVELPVVLMAHQPTEGHLKAAEERGVGLMVSGHTHGGQVWPITWLIDRMWPVPQGMREIGKTRVFVTRGLGGWGAPLRVGARAEVVLMVMRFVRADGAQM